MSDGAMKAEFVDRIDCLTELADAERELQKASSRFEAAQWEVVKAAETLQEWAHVWQDRREKVLSRFPESLTPQRVTFYGQGDRLTEANEVMRQFCASVERKNAERAAFQSTAPTTVSDSGEGEPILQDKDKDEEAGEGDLAKLRADLAGLDMLEDPADGLLHDKPLIVDDTPTIPRSEIPQGAAVETFTDAGVETVKLSGITHIVDDSPERVAEAQPEAAYAPIHNVDEPVTNPVADDFAKGILHEIDAKDEKRSWLGLFGAGKKETADAL